MNNSENLTYPIIIMRNGGLDGVALQAREYRQLLNRLNINVHVMTGKCETKFAPRNPIGHQQTVLSRLDFYHKDSQLIFANQFIEGDEKLDIDEISLDEWKNLFEIHKNKIKKAIDKILISIPNNTPCLVYNLVSLRHAQPAAAVAIKELMEKYPNRAFLSHSADPDAERPEKINRIKPECLEYISANLAGEEYSGGPYPHKNLYHIVLNPTQHSNFRDKYNIPEERIFEIPDFLDFPSAEPIIKKHANPVFLKFISERALCLKGDDAYKYQTTPVDRETIFFLSPVRPVYRKRLRRAMLVAQQYGKLRNKKVAFVVTHPNTDDKQYFLKTIKYAEDLGLPYYHLGEHFSLETLESIYRNFSSLYTIGVIASSAGGWENALNEMAEACIPFYMDKNLNSFKPLTEQIGIWTHGTDFSKFYKFVENQDAKELGKEDLSEFPEIKGIIKWLDTMLFDKEKYDELIYNNYKKAYDYLSHDATIPKLVEGINFVYEQHGNQSHRVNTITLSRILNKDKDLEENAKKGEILYNKEFQNGYFKIKFYDPKIAEKAKPGQFIHLKIANLADKILRRPFSICNVSEQGTVTILYKVVGAGTEALSKLQVGTICNLLGPLGNPFTVPKDDVIPIIVAGGYGSAATYILAQKSKNKGYILLGARSRKDLVFVKEFQKVGCDVRTATEDGSMGYEGLVTDLIPKVIEENPNKKVKVFACGPTGMLMAVGKICNDIDVNCELSLDHLMCCGVGACFACVVKVKADNADGWRYARTCNEGPIFDAKDVYYG